MTSLPWPSVSGSSSWAMVVSTLVVGVAGRGHREHRLGHLDLDLRGGRLLAAVRDAEGGDRVGPGRGVGDGRPDVGARGGDEREGDGRSGGREHAEAREGTGGRLDGHGRSPGGRAGLGSAVPTRARTGLRWDGPPAVAHAAGTPGGARGGGAPGPRCADVAARRRRGAPGARGRTRRTTPRAGPPTTGRAVSSVTKRWAATICQVQPGSGLAAACGAAWWAWSATRPNDSCSPSWAAATTGSRARTGTSRVNSSRPPASTTAVTRARPGAVGTVPPAQVCAESAPVTTTTVAARARARACGARACTTLGSTITDTWSQTAGARSPAHQPGERSGRR